MTARRKPAIGRPPHTAVALALVAACVLHGVAFWLLHTPATGVRSTMVQWRGSSAKKVLAADAGVQPTVIPATIHPTPTPAAQPVLENVVPPIDPAPVEDDLPAGKPGFDAYTPSTLLDEGPIVVQDVPSDPPELLGRSENGSMILTLYIAASGTVDEVVVESSDLPEVFAEVARRDFLGARFNPGMRNGQAVPSSMRVEVTFGSTPAAIVAPPNH